MKRVILSRVGMLVVLLVVVGAVLERSENLSPVRAAPQEIVINLSGGRIKSASLATADFNGDGYKEIVAAGDDGMLYVVSTSNGTTWSEVWSHQVNVEIEAANPPTSKSTNEIDTSPVVADLDSDGKLDIVIAVGGSIYRPESDRHNGGVLVYEYDYAWHFSPVAGWPQPKIDAAGGDAGYGSPDGLWDGYQETPAVGDLDGDGDLEIVFSGPGRRIHAYHHTGVAVTGWPIYRYNGDNLLRGSHLSSPALGDIDGDGLPEVVVGTESPPWGGEGSPAPDYNKSTLWAINGDSSNVPGFPVTTEQHIYSSPALGDIDNDNQLEIVTGAGWGTSGRTNIVYAWNHDGTLLPNWPRTTAGVTAAGPALGDIDNDGNLEIVIGCGNDYDMNSCNKLYAWNADGTSVPNFPVEPPTPTSWRTGSYAMPFDPILADFDGDGDVEILIVQLAGEGITIVDPDGTTFDNTSYPFSGGGLYAPPVVDDVDNDGKLEILVGGGNSYGIIRIWDENGAAGSARPWPMFRRNIERTGLYPMPVFYDISGQTMHANGQPFSGITITGSGGLGDVIADASGNYEFTDLDEGAYTLTPSYYAYLGFVFSPPTRTVTLPPDAAGQSFVVLPAPVSSTLSAAAPTPPLIYTDTQGLPTQLDFPDYAAGRSATTLVLTPTMASGGAGFAFTGHAFELAAYQKGVLQPGFTFSSPVTITIHYSEDDVQVVTDENDLILNWWTANGAWHDAAQTCNPASTYVRDVGNNVLSVPICHLSKFGLLGPTNNVYLPSVMLNG